MQLTMPTIDLPWRRRTPIERTQAELHKVQKQIGRQIEKMQLPKIELPRVKAQDVDAVAQETRKAVDTGIEQVAIAADEIGREAGKWGREAGKRGSELTRELSKELAKASDRNLKDLRTDLKGLSDDVRALRVTREKRGPDMMPGIALLAGLGAGLGAMYFFDPEHGRRRRALMRDQLTKWSRITSESLNGQMKDLRNRSVGMAHELRRGVESVSSSAEQRETEMAGTTPDAAGSLAGTDQAAGQEQPVSQTVGGSWGEDLSVPEGSEGQPDVGRAH